MNDYGYNRKRLMLPEYGRHVHNMVDYLMSIEDRKERTYQSEVVVEIMKNINTSLKESDNVMNTLWNHLYIISDFKLDVDSPFPKPSTDIINIVPERLNYPSKEFSMKHYGKNIKQMIKVVASQQEAIEDKEIISVNIAKFMQLKSLEYNNEHPNNTVILNDLKRMSGDNIVLDESTLNNIKTEYKQNFVKRTNKKNFTQNNSSNRSRTGSPQQNNQNQKYKNQRFQR
ncbi:MAG: DUF4290 domain-containing protein [Rikenellaceae bacterium]